MKLIINENEDVETSNHKETKCKFCNHPIDLTKTHHLPKKLISEKHGLCWTGLEKLYLFIYKVRCENCKKKYSYKLFKSEFNYK